MSEIAELMLWSALFKAALRSRMKEVVKALIRRDTDVLKGVYSN
jgi:hypothetical protein